MIQGGEKCARCIKTVYAAEKISAASLVTDFKVKSGQTGLLRIDFE